MQAANRYIDCLIDNLGPNPNKPWLIVINQPIIALHCIIQYGCHSACPFNGHDIPSSFICKKYTC